MTGERVNVLGVGISPINMQQAIHQLDEWIAADDRQYVCVANVHLVMECYYSSELRQICNAAGMVTPDGMPLVWLNHWRGFPTSERVYGPDLLLAMCEHSVSKGYRHYLYGGEPSTVRLLAESLQRLYAGLDIVGIYSPPFHHLSNQEQDQIVNQINAAEPDIVWIGLGAPKQERWMHEFRDRLNAPVLIGVGAAFDYHAGHKKQAPRWMQARGLEWAFRLWQEPRRLWKRYIPNNFLFIILSLAQASGIREYRLD